MSETAQQRSLGRKLLTGVSTLAITGLTFAFAGFAIVQGADGIAQRAEAAPPPPVAEALPVSVTSLEVEDGYETVRNFVGRIEPEQESTLGFEFGGRVTEILVDEGDQVTEGEIVARLDTSLLEAEQARLEAVRDALAADLSFATLSVERRQVLQERGFSSKETLDRARFDRDALTARIAETDAALKSTELRIEKSALRAPFSGIVGARTTDIGTTVASGAPILQLLTSDVVNVRVGVPLWLEPENLEEATLHGAGYEVYAQLIAVRPDIDPVTRTRTAILRINAIGLPFGTTVTVSVPRHVTQEGAWVDIRALRESFSGVWTVLVVDAENRVRHLAIEVQEVQGARAFVSGGFEPGVKLIVEGPQRIVPGQLVRLIEADSVELALDVEGK